MKSFRFLPAIFRRGKEDGWSLVNTIVTVVLTMIIGTVAVSLIVAAQRGSNNFTDTVMTEAELNNAMSSITRQLTTAESIIIADDNLVKVANVEDDVRQDTTFFAWTPAPEAAKWDEFKGYLTGDNATGKPLAMSDLPNFPAVVAATSSYDSEGNPEDKKPEVRVLVNGYIQDESTPLFTYFNGGEDSMTTPVSDDEVNNIKRVQVQLRAVVEGRDAPMELASSVTPRAGLSGTLGESHIGSQDAPVSVMLTGNLPPRSTTSTLNWNNVDGADSYTLYRENAKQEVNPKVVGTTQETTMVDKGLTPGETYRYYVVATNVNGLSPKSNIVALTATPPAPVLSGEVNDSYTNDLSWTRSNGAVGYRILKDGQAWKSVTGINTLSITDTETRAGESHTYKVVAYNNAGTGSGNSLGVGDSPWSNEVTLYANPATPVLTGSVNKGDRILKWTSVPGATSYELKRISPSAKTFPKQAGRTYTDIDQHKSSSFKYQVRAHNPSGASEWSNIVDLNPIPDPVQPKVEDWNTNSNTYNMKNKTWWEESPQATFYEWRIGKVDRGGGDTWGPGAWETQGEAVRAAWHNLPARDADTEISYDLRACNYTGCSELKWDWGKQPPGAFSVQGHVENSRTGYRSLRPDSNRALQVQEAKFWWNLSEGADGYSFSGAGKTGSNSATKDDIWISGYTPGATTTVNVTAKGSVSGINRNAAGYKWQSTPAQPHSIKYRFQYRGASNGDTRLRFWSDDYSAVTGKYDNIYIRYGLRYRSSDSKPFSFSRTSSETWANFNTIRSTQHFVKRNLGPEEYGGIAWGMTEKTVASGYAGSHRSQDSNSSRGWWMTDGQDDNQYNGGYRGIYGGTSTNQSTSWTASNSGAAAGTVSDWTNVPFSARNYPTNAENGSTDTYYSVFSR